MSTLMEARVGLLLPPNPVDDAAATKQTNMLQEHVNTTPSDSLLIAQICQGQEHALAVLYDRYSRLLYSIALRVTGDRSSAEEVLQDVFQSVWRSVGGFQIDGSVKAWLMGITRHRAIDATRVRNFRGHSQNVPFDAILDIGQGEPTDEQVFAILEGERVQRALAELSTGQRQAIELAYYSGFTRAAIGEHLGLPLGTVKTRIRLGLQKLRELLQNAEA